MAFAAALIVAESRHRLGKAPSAAVEEKLTANNEHAVARGVFGVPTFFVNEEMFFGNDRLSFVKTRLDPAYPKVAQ